jgi:hypothetical protein
VSKEEKDTQCHSKRHCFSFFLKMNSAWNDAISFKKKMAPKHVKFQISP